MLGLNKMTVRINRRALVLLGAVLLLPMAACEEEPATQLADEGVRDISWDAIQYGGENHLTLNGVNAGLIASDSAFLLADSTLSYMFGVAMSLYNEQGFERARVTGDSARMNTRTEEITVWGNVFFVVPAQDVRIQSQVLNYDPQRDEIWSDEVTAATINGSSSTGTCFRSDLQFQSWNVCEPRGDIPRRPPGTSGNGGNGGTGGNDGAEIR